MAATSGSVETATLLLDKGADPNSKEAGSGQTPLSFAAAFDRPEVIKLLASRGADIDLATQVREPVTPQRGQVPGQQFQQGQQQGQQAQGQQAQGQQAQGQGAPQAAGGRGGRGGRGAQGEPDARRFPGAAQERPALRKQRGCGTPP